MLLLVSMIFRPDKASSVIWAIGVTMLVCALLIPGCKQPESENGPLTLVSLGNGTADLMDPNNTTTIGSKDIITAVFSSAIDPLTITAKSVTMIRDYDQVAVPLVLILHENKLTIKSVSDLLTGTSYTLDITSDVMSKQGQPFASFTVSFRTTGSFVPPGLKAYWGFEKSPLDDIGTLDPDPNLGVRDIIYVPGRSEAAGFAAQFNGTTSLIEAPSASSLLTSEFSISFWMYVNSVDHTDSQGKKKSSYVLGIGNFHGVEFDVDSTYRFMRFGQGYILQNKALVTNDFQFAGTGYTYQTDTAIIHGGIDNATLVNENFGSAGISDRLDNKWSHIVMTFQDTTLIRSLYINGALVYQQDLRMLNKSYVNESLQSLATTQTMKFIPDTLIPASYDDRLVFGFWQSQESTYGLPTDVYTNHDAYHFKGALDDIRIFSRTLTAEEIQMMYADEKP